jgi:hypothetical protein
MFPDVNGNLSNAASNSKGLFLFVFFVSCGSGYGVGVLLVVA